MNILAINPWIYDCAAYDFWLKPYGFLVILSYLKSKGANIDYIDCLDKKTTKGDFGRGKIYCENIDKPEILKKVPRRFKKYGLTNEEFEDKLKDKSADFILISSSMTYWYPAIIDATKILKKTFPHTPIILGGTYATLLTEHAKNNIPCDFVFKSSQLREFFQLLNLEFEHESFYATLPDYEDFYRDLDYIVLRTSWGCPFSCSYCAIKELSCGFFRIPQQKIIKFIIKYANATPLERCGVKDFVLYDDAFLYPAPTRGGVYESNYAKELLKEVIKLNLNLRFHTPNALHLRFIDSEIALLLKEAGFINPHFGLETLNPKLQKLWGDKVNRSDLMKGIKTLKKAGFKDGEFSLYLLLGYPGQNLKKLKKEIEFLHSQGAKVSLSEFSPVPKTKIFQKYKTKLSEPLFHNNSIFGFFQSQKWKEIWEIKNYTRELNRRFLTLQNDVVKM